MQFSTLLLSLSATTALALPHDLLPRAKGSSSELSKISLPQSALPAVDSSLELKYATLGVGTQNYTCSATPKSSAGAPVSVGAVAELFDAAPLLTMGNTRDATLNMEQSTPALALGLFESTGLEPSQLPFPLNLKQVGNHFFGAGLVPTFVLDKANPSGQIACKKTGDIPAPAGAYAGAQGEGAVDWLQLGDNALGFSAGTPLEGGAVYRIETAGGMQDKTCANREGDFEVKYSALYFFFGPKN
ncbi:hypothetical protein NA57DRAFT_79366 [Rhizodiscina lignyota]|uniref:Malate dehydrogenase n=1 Tax=Rhizodiscina lignyota TaxID=1504668 RepID=A0A9P4M5T9_9PEZI|nr:hypothetical protein NA57DRAFT_79366 [Rhizodiscina lignyota]